MIVVNISRYAHADPGARLDSMINYVEVNPLFIIPSLFKGGAEW